jgi:transposase
MRRSFDGLAVATRQFIGSNPLSGHLFVFFNRRNDICKALWWASGGFCLFAKRLAKGRFGLPKDPPPDGHHVEMSAAELTLILEGIDLRGAKKRTRWQPKRRNNELFGNNLSV